MPPAAHDFNVSGTVTCHLRSKMLGRTTNDVAKALPTVEVGGVGLSAAKHASRVLELRPSLPCGHVHVSQARSPHTLPDGSIAVGVSWNERVGSAYLNGRRLEEQPRLPP